MTHSRPVSPKSPASSRPSSASDSARQDTHTTRSSLQTGLPPLRHLSTPPAHAMGVAGSAPALGTEDEYASPPERLPKKKSDEFIRPSSSSPSPQALEGVTGADHDDGTIGNPGAPTPARQKKKRTRTLTTPHQSAVLHALLAQSRFPTTAVREEVGRSIGLSARKVQVWFQNQRQKARKPRNQSIMPLNESLPQFEGFPPGSRSESTPVAGPSSSSTPFQGEDSANVYPQSAHISEHRTPHMHRSGPSAHYPGLPQYSTSDASERPRSRNPSLASQSFQYSSLGHDVDPPSSGRTRSSPFAPETQGSFPTDPYDRHHSVPVGPMTRGSEPPIVLPPLRFDQPRGGQPLPPPPIHNEPYHGLTTRPAQLSASSSSTSSISSSPASSFPPSFTLPPPPSRHSESIPPPFTLQPQPQWDSSNPIQGRTPALPPTDLSRSPHPLPAIGPRRGRTNSDPPRRHPLLSMLVEEGRPRDQQPISSSWSQSNLPSSVGSAGRRFDPVHAALREGEAPGGRPGGDEGGNPIRRNRHTYHFTRPSSSVPSPSTPPEDNDDEMHRRNG